MNVFDPAKKSAEFIENFSDQHGLHDAYVVTSVGRITWLKDYETFIKAIAKIKSKIPNVKALIVGGVGAGKEDYFESLKALAESGGIGQGGFTGSQSRVSDIYYLSDVVVNGSLKMGNIGRTIVESLAMNTPVVATMRKLTDIIVDGTNGYYGESRMKMTLLPSYRYYIRSD